MMNMAIQPVNKGLYGFVKGIINKVKGNPGNDKKTNKSSSQLKATWPSEDPESGIAEYAEYKEYQYSITDKDGKTIVPWTPVGNQGSGVKSYQYSITDKDGKVIVPWTPVETNINDLNQLKVSWANVGQESGVKSYQYSITDKDGKVIVPWTPVETK